MDETKDPFSFGGYEANAKCNAEGVQPSMPAETVSVIHDGTNWIYAKLPPIDPIRINSHTYEQVDFDRDFIGTVNKIAIDIAARVRELDQLVDL